VFDTPAVIALRDGIRTGAGPEALHEEVCAVVDHLKAAGWPLERVIVAVKRIAADAGLRPTRLVLSATATLGSSDALLVRIVQWSIERYSDAQMTSV